LHQPRRWEKHNKLLGDDLKSIRADIEEKSPIDLSKYKSIELIVAKETDLYAKGQPYNKKIWNLQTEKNLLIIHPESGSISPRKEILSKFGNSMLLVEAIDDKDFYSLASDLDTCTSDNIELTIRKITFHLFNPTVLNIWFSDTRLKRKTKPEEIITIQPIKEVIVQYEKRPSLLAISEILRAVRNLPGIKCYRPELFKNLIAALNLAQENSIPVHEAMMLCRNIARKSGRRVEGRCLGTTLLTKGLEFDTVVVLNAHKFKSPKHLYVALTRARKKLVVISENKTLSPY
jgi:superfamily I DNA/RNA helicase